MRRGPALAVLVSLVILAGCSPSARTTSRPAGSPTSMIVRAVPGQAPVLEAAVVSLGGRVKTRLGIINGFSALIPRAATGILRSLPGTLSVTPDLVLRAEGSTYASAGSFDAIADMGSMYNLVRITGALTYWKNGYTGKGVDVALLDSGVTPVDGLTAPGKVLAGPDLSFESQATNLQYMDTFGHGTHMAGIIAGRSNAAGPGTYAGDTKNFLGMAPDARIVSIKVADAHGATDVSQVVAAIDWVVQHRSDNGMNIRVLNLSYGTHTAQSYVADPLAFAAEQAWKAGIVVVAAAGNSGFQRNSTTTLGLSDPAYDPYVLGVGGSDPMGTLSLGDDRVSSFSAGSTGCSTCKNPDFVAPAAHLVSLRDPGSQIDQAFGSTGVVTGSLFRGSGTSQAAAVVSGAAALIISRTPTITPDRLKRLLTSTAQKLAGAVTEVQGYGEIRLAKAYTNNIASYVQKFTPATGTGSLDSSRGLAHLMMDGVSLSGSEDIFGTTFDSAAMASLEASAKAWSGGTWNAKSWSGEDWSGKAWSGTCWTTTTWTAKSWSGTDWGSLSWSTNNWMTSGWSGGAWSTNNWLSGDWANDIWADASWS
jgi:serine protease AprX